jgi:thiamine biosynthesis lipoprotein
VPGCAGVELDHVVRAVRLPRGVALDLGGIGKGTAADEVSAELLDAGVPGVTGVLVNLGGDLRARGEAPQPHGWVVAVDDPLETGRTGLLALAEGAVATSTKLRRTWTRGERSLHHLIDPRTGAPAESGVASVTVVAGEAWRAEVLAKAAFVAGPADGRALLEGAGVTGLLVTDDGDVLELEGLAAFRPSPPAS